MKEEKTRGVAVAIMAAGKGTRMKDPSRAKVMYELLGRPMIHYVVDLAYQLNADPVIVIVGYQRDAVVQYIEKLFPRSEIAEQTEQLGTGHAVMQTEQALKNFYGDVIVLSGDVPLLSAGSMQRLVNHHFQTQAVATILTADLDDPAGYGRIIRNDDESVKRIVEHKDATEEERRVKEINSGIYIFDKEKLFEALKQITPHNVQKEYYLTDVFEYFSKHRWRVSALRTTMVDEIRGINTLDQLKEAETIQTARERS
ncbi:MAG: UDP-N-acetylglucosamine pyrophosphorylase [Ignavibacteriae bacterium]|nr:MAG: UDP-N-acetylglucosamine pyrophosphorylase [Ignavibacteriota bacterium]